MALAVIPGRTRIVATPRLKGSVIPGILPQAGAGQGTLAEFDSSVERNTPEARLDSAREIQLKKIPSAFAEARATLSVRSANDSRIPGRRPVTRYERSNDAG
jgi:hypothetical protein